MNVSGTRHIRDFNMCMLVGASSVRRQQDKRDAKRKEAKKPVKYIAYRKTIELGASIAVTLPPDFVHENKIEPRQIICALVDGTKCSFMTIQGLGEQERGNRKLEDERRSRLKMLPKK